ncbi:glycoside hydrolase family 127 protein [Pseudokineococcus lusitanus]|uniref:Glycoside hydrolase family 127 protein n=1 Tax=Pseudokineococcus lusitanus TaxID=763993 RepID=A0A3N1HKW5_9ACTN|nr:beta-L-arabinofuranosidase domain-containing protein [Pseudokineococcus lusitanus]ROP43173.1 hypothetical protein EDC03_1770 [Pseudokineococcus lusitanus]
MTSLTAPPSAAPATGGTSAGTPVLPSTGALRPLGLDEVRVTGGRWARRQDVNARATLAHVEHWLEREGWLGNFDAAVEGRLPHDRRGREFSDSEVYKLLEALSWEHGRTGDAWADARVRAITARVAAAQEPDGYLGTMFGRPGQAPRWSALEWGHELYCLGHLVQAAVARARTVGTDDDLVRVAVRAADHLCDVFGPGGVESVCGHAEVEPALVELSRVTGERRYLEQARLFVERRGHHVLADVEYGRSYFQDDVPVREAPVLRGHAVRATYLAAGTVDVAVETGDDGLLDAVRRQWARTVARRTYVTGGMGARHQDEAFGEDFVLPPDRAYAETCAGIGSVMLAWRLLLAGGGAGAARYADLVERTLDNVVAASPSHDGRRFFYTNTLHQREPGSVPPEDVAVGRAASSLRAPWFGVSCCPTNVARTVASLGGYVATTDDDGLQLHLHLGAEVRAALPDGTPVDVDVDVEEVDGVDGVVRVRVLADAPRAWSLSVRVPGWAAGAVLEEPDGPAGGRPVDPGTAVVRRAFRAGDEVVLRLPTAPRLVRADPRVDAVRGAVAVERGSEVLCLESVDLPGGAHVDRFRLDPSAAPRVEDGLVVVRGRLLPDDEDGDAAGGDPGAAGAWPYPGAGTEAAPLGEPVDVVLRPYEGWGERGPATMRVWLPVAGADDASAAVGD